MKKIHSTENATELEHIKSLLEENGITYLVKNQALSGAMGEIPPLECCPEIWIQDDNRHQQAISIVAAVTASTNPDLSPWQCVCGEEIEAQFSACWQCGESRPD